MRERPVVFSGPSVRAILDGSKTQTRRVLNPQPMDGWEYQGQNCLEQALFYPPSSFGTGAAMERAYEKWDGLVTCPFGVPGDTLWVRETWNAAAENPRAFPGRHGHRWWDEVPMSMRGRSNAAYLFYRADAAEVFTAHFEDGFDLVAHWEHMTMAKPRTPPKWRSPRFMPRWASRVRLHVVSTRVEHLHDITEGGAVAEGAMANPNMVWQTFDEADRCEPMHAHTARDAFAAAWDALNGRRGFGWESNPWVWVLNFTREVG